MKETKSMHQQFHLAACNICNRDSFFADLSYLDLVNVTLELGAVDFSFDLRVKQRVRLLSVATLVFGVNENSVSCEKSDLWLEPLLIVLCNRNILCRNSMVYMIERQKPTWFLCSSNSRRSASWPHLAALFQLQWVLHICFWQVLNPFSVFILTNSTLSTKFVH